MASESCIATRLHRLAMSPATFSLLTIPNELNERMLSKLSKGDVRNLRATCKLFYNLTSPLLFRHIVLLPFRRCLTRFLELIKNSHLAVEVREIRYDHFWDGTIQALLNRRLNPKQALVLSTAQENQFTTPSDQDDELQLLTSIIAHLPHLRHVTVREYFHPNWKLDEEDVPESFHQVISLVDPEVYMMNMPHRIRLKSASNRALIAASAAPSTVASFSADGLDLVHMIQEWRSTHSDYEASLLRDPLDLSRLKCLEISDMVKTEGTQQYAESFLRIITTAVSLETLKLHFSDSWVFSSDEPEGLYDTMNGLRVVRMFNHVGYQFPNLNSLTLSGLCCMEQDLLGFLFRQVGTLRSLELSFLTLVCPTWNAKRPCVIKVLGQLRALGLENFLIEEVLSNTGNQHLRFGGPIWDRHDLKPVRSAITSWVTNQVDEIPEVLRKLAIQPGEDDLRLPEKENPGWKHDEIWKFVEMPSSYLWEAGEENPEANWINDNGAEQDTDLGGDENLEEEERSVVESESEDDEWEL